MLDRDQAAIAHTLLNGPDYLPPDLFAGNVANVLRGLQVHANTISHARLVALEDSFSRTRAHLGEAEFNRLSRIFVETGGAQGRSIAAIGAGFPDWLSKNSSLIAADIARAEWAWLDCYHAAEAPALALADFAGLDEAQLLALPVRRHPAARVVTLASDAAPILDFALPSRTQALLVTRPETEVRIFPATLADAALLGDAEKIEPLGNFIGRLAELQGGDGASVAPLIAAGAFERV